MFRLRVAQEVGRTLERGKCKMQGWEEGEGGRPSYQPSKQVEKWQRLVVQRELNKPPMVIARKKKNTKHLKN